MLKLFHCCRAFVHGVRELPTYGLPRCLSGLLRQKLNRHAFLELTVLADIYQEGIK